MLAELAEKVSLDSQDHSIRLQFFSTRRRLVSSQWFATIEHLPK